MESYDNLTAIEQPWALNYRPSLSDAWISDVFTRETDTLTNALQMSFSGASSDGDSGAFSTGMVDSLFFNPENAPPIQTPTASGISENDPAVVPSKPRRSVPPIGGRVAKRKSRASKRATTTFITADAANFRQMVQQVTGIRNGGMPAALLKPEPHRAIDMVQMGGGNGMQAFDNSGFFLDGSGSMPAAPAAGGKRIEFDSYYSFPTLESYVVN